MTAREHILSRLALAERDEASIPLGCAVRLRELTRAQHRDAVQWAASGDLAERERQRGVALATANLADEDARRVALTQFWLGAPEQVVNIDRWHAALFAAGAHDPETGDALFTREEILEWPDRAELWGELHRLAQAILNVSEVGPGPLKSGDPAPAAE